MFPQIREGEKVVAGQDAVVDRRQQYCESEMPRRNIRQVRRESVPRDRPQFRSEHRECGEEQHQTDNGRERGAQSWEHDRYRGVCALTHVTASSS
jgi:hypothetical protein